MLPGKVTVLVMRPQFAFLERYGWVARQFDSVTFLLAACNALDTVYSFRV